MENSRRCNEITKEHVRAVNEHTASFKMLTEIPQFILFLYLPEKRVYSFRIDKSGGWKKAIKYYNNLFKFINPKIKSYKRCLPPGDIHHLIFCKGKIDLKRFINEEQYRSKMYGIPLCCAKKYLEEEKKERISYASFYQAVRYVEQCSKLKNIKNEFVIIKDIGVECQYGFVPCSPKCKKALKIRQKYFKICTEFAKLQNRMVL